MTVYVDDMQTPFGRMKMCHMLADTDDELHAMADRIGVDRRWWQTLAQASTSHYDVCLAKKATAIKAGAVSITARQAAAMSKRRRIKGELGKPEEAIAWFHHYNDAHKKLKLPPADATRLLGLGHLTLEEYEALEPDAQGYACYMQAAWPGSPIPDKNPYPEGTPNHDLWARGANTAMLECQEMEDD